MTYSTTIYAANTYASSSLQELGVFSAVSVGTFASGFKSVSNDSVASVQVDVLSSGFPTSFGSSFDSIITDPFSASTFVVLGQSIASVDMAPFGDWSTSRSGFTVSNVNASSLGDGFKTVLGFSITSIIIDTFGHMVFGIARSAVAEVLVGTSAEAEFSPVVNFDNEYWNWPLVAQYDHPHIYYTRPGHHWTNGRSNVSRSRAVYRFYGVQARIVLPKGLDKGFVDIYIDGKHEGRQDLFDVVKNNFVHNILGLEPGLHEVRLVPLGRHHPASQDSFVQVGSFAHKAGMVTEDKGEEVFTDKWSATTTNV